jgi:pantetheine-phosphate adenylyltransferase
MVAGSFDPITNGHEWLIRQALEVCDKVFVIVGNNPAKKYMFTGQERANMVHRVIGIDDYDRFVVDFLHNDLLINVAHDSECNFLIRGIRNSEFLIPPRELTEVSSSTVKGLVGFNGWEDVVSTYVHPVVLDALKPKVRK